ncbi:MAG TPA: TonB-dependent receptor [Longimicrobiales bacterium]|nr:TonB-dependent receptor [Longimicrobiales bacterium]
MRSEVRNTSGEWRDARPASRRWAIGLLPALLAVLVVVPAAAQQTRVVGSVTSGESGQALAGVNVMVKGTPIGTLTNATGRFTLQVPSPNDTLVFALIGFADLEEPLNGRTTLTVALDVSAVALAEIVVTGYGTQQRRDVTGSVSSLDGSEVTEMATPSVVQSLQGKVAGMQVTPISGEPGADAIVRIRGVGTLNDASPLYVVDGMLVDDIQFLSAHDVQSVDVLKDASATAIYGSRGANGVIIITTKRGVESRRTTYRLNAYAGTQSVLNPIDMVNAQQYAELINELEANLGGTPPFPTGYTGPDTDWQDEIFESAPIQNVQFTASGGTDRITYYFSANYIDQSGVIPHSAFERMTVRLNNDYALSPAIKIGHNLNFTATDDQRPPNVLGSIYHAEPTVAPRNDDGTFNEISRATTGNPAASVFYTNNRGGAQRMVGNVYGEATFLDNFLFRSSFGLDYERTNFRSFVPVFYVSATQQNVESNVGIRFENTDSWLWENTLTWNYLADPHRLTVLGGITAQSFYNEDFGGSRVNVAGDDPSLWYLNAAAAEGSTNFNSASDWRMLSYLFRTNYTLMDRYLFTGSMRVDGSSRFGETNRYGYFPSLAVGWDLAQESFMADMDAVSALKLRASWGKIGNDKIGSYPAVALITGNLNYPLGGELRYGAAPISLANPDVRWEETGQYNIGVDAAFWGGRVQTTVDYYNRTTEGILVRVPIPSYVGVNQQPFVNAAEVRNKGLEGLVTWFGQVGPLNLELSANGATIDNEVLALGQGREEIFGGAVAGMGFTTRTVPGEPIGAYWGYRVEGVFQTPEEIASSPIRGGEQPGDLRYADLNGDGVINAEDMTFIGSPIPDVIYGFDADLRLGAFDMGIGFSGQSGNEVLNAKKARRFHAENFEVSYLDRWNGVGTSNWEPRITSAGHNYQPSERWLEDGSFLKLHSARLGYRVPQELSQRMGVDLARLYVSGTSLFLWTDYSGYTPELTSGTVINSGLDQLNVLYPPARIVTVGVDLSF